MIIVRRIKENYMTLKANTIFKITGWNEETITELEEVGKLKRARVSYNSGLRIMIAA
jgi:hypothetical protein